MIKGVLLDLAGVVYDGDRPVPGALDAIEALRAARLHLRFVSNTTRSTRQTMLDRLAAMGLALAEDELFTPAQAAVEWLRAHDASAHLLVHKNLESEFDGLPEGTGRAVVVGDAGTGFTYEALNAAYRELEAGADFLALAPNRVFRDSDGSLSLDAGPFVKALEYACGRPALVLGKPAPSFFLSALADMGCAKEEAAMVGDDAETDVAGALSAGLEAGLLVRTGKYREGDEDRFQPAPTAVVDDLAAAAEWIIRSKTAVRDA